VQVPPSVLPILETVSRNPRFRGRVATETWRTEDHRLWVEAFLELGCELFASDIPEEGLPDGYILTAFLFDWEAQCQSEGWSAFSNRRNTIDRVVDCYRRIDLADEAEAIQRAHQAWLDSDESHEAASAAYHSVRPRLGEEDRLIHMDCHLVDNADRLFYVESVV